MTIKNGDTEICIAVVGGKKTVRKIKISEVKISFFYFYITPNFISYCLICVIQTISRKIKYKY